MGDLRIGDPEEQKTASDDGQGGQQQGAPQVDRRANAQTPAHEWMQRPAGHRTADAEDAGPVGGEAHARRLAGGGGQVDVIAFDVQPVDVVSRFSSIVAVSGLRSIVAGVKAKSRASIRKVRSEVAITGVGQGKTKVSPSGRSAA
jgi:hypothetical protein